MFPRKTKAEPFSDSACEYNIFECRLLIFDLQISVTPMRCRRKLPSIVFPLASPYCNFFIFASFSNKKHAMNFIKICLLTAFFAVSHSFSVVAQSGDYQYLVTLKPDMQRKVLANELFLSPDGKYIIVNYGNKPTFIAAYSTSDWKQVALFRLKDWVDFSSAYLDTTNQQFYVKISRVSTQYHRLDIKQNTQDIIPCDITPRGCPHIEMKMDVKSLYTKNKQYYIAINKQNKREVKVYKIRTDE